jgi:hypothetical protein
VFYEEFDPVEDGTSYPLVAGGGDPGGSAGARHEFYRDYLTEAGEVLEYAPDASTDLITSLSVALGGRRLQSVVPRCSCGWRGTEIDRSVIDVASGRPERDPFAQWFLRHMDA